NRPERQTALRGEGHNSRGTRRRFSGRAAGGLFSGLRASGSRQRALALPLRPLFASSGGSHVQSVRARASLRRRSRQALKEGFAEHKGTPVKIALIDYRAGNVPSSELCTSSERKVFVPRLRRKLPGQMQL